MISPTTEKGSLGGARRRQSFFRDEVQEHYVALLRRLPCCDSSASTMVRTLGVTSCSRGEGVSTVAAHLAAAAASLGHYRVLLADLNLQRPNVHRIFQVNRGPGVAEALIDRSEPQSLVQESAVDNLWLLTVGTPVGESADHCSLSDLSRLISDLRGDYDLVVLDMPESTQASCALPLAAMLDGVVLVIEAERVRWEVAQRTKELLTRAGANLLGVVMNKRRQYVPRWLYRTL